MGIININSASRYGNDPMTVPFTKQCSDPDFNGTVVPYTVPANTFFAPTLAEANAMATANIEANGQANANTNGDCVEKQTSVINYRITRDLSPYVDGSFSLQKNGSTTDLFTFAGDGTSTGNYHYGDILSWNAFHYHLATRWPDDASLTFNLRQGGITGTIIKTYTGGVVGLADIYSDNITISQPQYFVEVITQSSDSSLKILGYDFINNTTVPDDVIKVSVVDETTGLYMLGQTPSEVPIPSNFGARSGAYNVKNDGNTQTVYFINTGGTTVNVTLTSLGGYSNTFSLAAGTIMPLPKTGVDKTGIVITVNP